MSRSISNRRMASLSQALIFEHMQAGSSVADQVVGGRNVGGLTRRDLNDPMVASVVCQHLDLGHPTAARLAKA
ncbi:hypothetical protein [Brevundimonas nasdae]|uniref:hypothetical protein n=1 Tax=Brevundimonas nasdae TaxID=172043 RepID=UPI000A52C02E|nr:hypothetical protein [Brevundimonas nasdae]